MADTEVTESAKFTSKRIYTESIKNVVEVTYCGLLFVTVVQSVKMSTFFPSALGRIFTDVDWRPKEAISTYNHRPTESWHPQRDRTLLNGAVRGKPRAHGQFLHPRKTKHEGSGAAIIRCSEDCPPHGTPTTWWSRTKKCLEDTRYKDIIATCVKKEGNKLKSTGSIYSRPWQ